MMTKLKCMHWALVSLSILSSANLSAISIVYNFRIAQITKQPIFEQAQRNHMVVALLFDQYQKKYDGTRQNFGGGLAAFIYSFASHYYVRGDFAASHIRERNSACVTTYSGTKTDDILFTLGRNFVLNDRATMTLSGLFGVPTHKIFTLQHVDFGYGQIGTGIQLDGSCALHCGEGDILYGARYIYFVPRNALDSAGQRHRFTIGNIADLLVAYKNYWGKHGLEFGYTARWDFGAKARPDFDDIVEKTNYTRNNFYIVYKYKFLVNNVSHRFLFNIAYGFDHKPKIFGNKYIVTLWASWTVGF